MNNIPPLPAEPRRKDTHQSKKPNLRVTQPDQKLREGTGSLHPNILYENGQTVAARETAVMRVENQ